jgi:PilZ domain-containing protein
MQQRLIERRQHRRGTSRPGTLLSFSLLTNTPSQTDLQQGDAMLLNLSLSGCKIESELPLLIGLHYRLLLQSRIDTTPVTINRATVIWGTHTAFGLRFIDTAPAEERAIKEILSQMPHTKM